MYNRNDLTASVLLARNAELAAHLKAARLQTLVAEREVFSLRTQLVDEITSKTRAVEAARLRERRRLTPEQLRALQPGGSA